jgi:hypothetical protein
MEFTKCLCILVLMYFSLAKKDGIQPCVAYKIKMVLAERLLISNPTYGGIMRVDTIKMAWHY